jgi:hypothetical protein
MERLISMPELLYPKEIQVKTLDGDERTYTISRFPSIAGREIIAKYPLSATPKLGDYAVNEETMLKLMSYVAVTTNGVLLRLTTKALVDNHVPDWETLARIEVAMLGYNTSFFRQGEVSTFLKGMIQKYLVSASPMLKTLLARLSEAAKQR